MRNTVIAMMAGLALLAGCGSGEDDGQRDHGHDHAHGHQCGHGHDREPGLDRDHWRVVAGDALRVLCTTFPMYQITRNVVEGREGTTVERMLPAQLGCPHDYSLSPQDARKLAVADVLVVNGLGLEEFLGAPVRNANSDLIVIDSAAGVGETIEYADGHSCSACDAHRKAPGLASGEDDAAEHHGHRHHDGVNPHLFASPRMAARLAVNIAEQLSRVHPAGKAHYTARAGEYAARLNALADELASLGARLANNRIVPSHGIFDYLARDMGLEVVAVLQAHGQEPSAAEMLALAKTIREQRVGAIFTEPQYPAKTGETLGREVGVKVAMLDPAATGPDRPPLDYYETVMRRNMEVLKHVLGVKP